MQPFRKLDVWKRSHALTLKVYALAARFPAEERFGLTSQMRRASFSAPSNIAEGSKRAHRRDFAHFLNVAEASLAELQNFLILSAGLGHVAAETSESLQEEAERICKMLYRLRISVLRQD